MDTDTGNGPLNNSPGEDVTTGKVMVMFMGIIVLLFVFVFWFFPELYAKGLDPSILRSLPVLSFNREEFRFKEGLECAVCLSEVEEGEKTRLLPECNHGFHVECIDMWFQSHSTCPLCRNQVTEQNSNSPTMGDSEQQVEPSSPTSASSRMLIIDIPQHMTENLSEEELDSPMARRLSCVEAEQVDRKEPDGSFRPKASNFASFHVVSEASHCLE